MENVYMIANVKEINNNNDNNNNNNNNNNNRGLSSFLQQTNKS